MVKMRGFIATLLAAGMLAGTVIGNSLSVQDKAGSTAADETRLRTARQQAEFEAGQKLAMALTENTAILLGTIVNVSADVKEKDVDEKNTASFRKVRVNVDEWLWRAPKEKAAVVELLQVTPPNHQKFNAGPWTTWNRVNVAAGNKLLIGLHNEKAANRAYRGQDIETSFVVSDVSMFPPLLQALSSHKRYLENPNELTGVVGLGNSDNDSVLLGYLVTYLWRGGTFGNRDVEALVLGRLLENSSLSDVPSRLVRLSLTRLLSSEMRPVSDATRRSVTQNLVAIGSGEDQKRAADAIKILLQLIDDKQLIMAPYLTPERQRKLAENYNTLVKTKQIGQRSAKFESQVKVG